MDEREHSRALRIGLLGGAGGCGTTSLAAAVGLVAGEGGHRVLLVDADQHGPALEVVLGIERESGPRWPDLAGLRGEPDAAGLLHRLPCTETGAWVLGGDCAPVPAHVRAGVVDALAEEVDVVVGDLGRQPSGDWDQLVLLTGPSAGAFVATSVVTDRLLAQGFSPWLVARGLDDDVALAVSEHLSLPLLGRLGHDRFVDEDFARGLPPARKSRSALRRTASEILVELLVRREGAA